MALQPERIRRLTRLVSVAVIIGVAIGFIVLLATSTGLRTIRGGRIGGDLPAFYAAGRIVAAGHTPRLYDAATQEAAQGDLLDGVSGRVAFAYPPYVALAYVPLTWLPFKIAYAVYTLAMALCLVAALRWLGRVLPPVRDAFLPALAATVACYPMFRALLGGQNTPISFLCASAAAVALTMGNDFVAGLWIGAWLFKPQLALPVAGLLWLRASKKRRFVAGIAALAAVYYIAGAAIAGWRWPMWWWHDGAMAFAADDLAIESSNGISFTEMAATLGLTPLNWIAAAVTVALALRLAWQQRVPAVAVTSFAALAALLVGPHAIYYDGGLAALGLIASAALRPSTLPAALAIWALAWLQPLRAHLPLPPVAVVVILTMTLAARTDRGHARF